MSTVFLNVSTSSLDFAADPIKKRVEVSGRLGLKPLGVDGNPLTLGTSIAARAGDGVASGRITRETRLRVVDTILTRVHEPGESHFQLLRAFVDDTVLQQVSAALKKHHYRTHEFSDFMLIECQFADDQSKQSGDLPT